MKKILATAAALFLLATSLAAFDWGGIISNTTKPYSSDFSSVSFYQTNGISFWVGQAFNKNLRFTTEALYKYELYNVNKTSSLINVTDLSLLKLSGSWTLGTGNLSVNAGRFSYSDLSSAVFSQNSDGLSLAYQTNTFKIGAYAGYTGLLNSLTVSMIDVNPDVTNKEFYKLCPAYIPLIADFSLINLAGTNISLQAEYFLASADYLKNKFYADLAVNGNIGSLFGYNLSAVLGSEDFKNFMLYGKGTAYIYLNNNFIVSAAGEYYSGNNGSLVPFRAITSKTIYNGVGALSSGLILPQASVLFVYNGMVISLGEKVVISMPSDEAKLAGFDTSLNFIYNVLSDLQVACSVIAYSDINVTSASNYAFVLNLSMAF